MKSILIVFSLILLSSCGDKKGDASAPGIKGTAPSADNYLGGNCGTKVISDHNSAVLECRAVIDREDIKECESLLIAFKAKYPNISCKAKKGSGLTAEEFYITESYINGLILTVQNL